MLEGARDGSTGGANPSKWTNEAMFVIILQHVSKYTKPTKEPSVILLLDHEVRQKAKDNCVVLHSDTSNPITTTNHL